MPTKRLTQKTVEKTSPPQSGRLELWDDLLPGLVLRITPSGARSYACMTRLHGKRIRVTIGNHGIVTLSEARDRARNIIQSAKKGEDPRPQKDAPRSTSVSALANDFIARYVKPNTRPSTAVEYERYLNNHVIPAWGDRDISDIRKRDVVLLIDHIREAGKPYAANRCLAAISKFFSWLVSRDVLESSPAFGVVKPSIEKARDRILSDTELKELWDASDSLNLAFRDFFRVTLLTGQRRAEVATMRWRDVDIDNGMWTLSSAFTKNKTTHTVPLSSAVIDILGQVLAHDGCEYVFTTTGTTPISGFSKLKESINKAVIGARRQAENVEAKEMQNWRVHDLRRTAATGMARLGIDRLHISKVLNHAEHGITGMVYERHRYDAEKRRALEAWAAHVTRIVTGNNRNVVPLRA